MSIQDLTAKLTEMNFNVINRDGEIGVYCPSPVVTIEQDEYISLDGDFTAAELRILADIADQVGAHK